MQNKTKSGPTTMKPSRDLFYINLLLLSAKGNKLKLPTRNLFYIISPNRGRVTNFCFSYLLILLCDKGNPLVEHCFGGDGGHSL